MNTHWFWTGNRPPHFDWIKKVVEQTQGWPLKVWGPTDFGGLNVDWGDDPRHVSNVVRYFLLYEYGGLWLDCDVIPLTDLCSNTSFVAGVDGRTEGGVMCFPEPGHPSMLEMLNVSLNNNDRSVKTVARSGCRILDGVIKHYDVRIRNDVFGHTSNGKVLNKHPKSVHLWSTSSGR